MSHDKKQAGFRLIIYLVLSFGLTWIWFAITIPKGETWNGMSQQMQEFVSLGMLFPAISHVLTRWITKEGFAMSGKDSMLLGISFKNRKWIYFLLALILPWIYKELSHIIAILIDPGCFDPEYYLSLDVDKKTLMFFPITAMVFGTVISFAAFGEEEGWRGYMMPKLLKLMPKAPALLIGGIIWGLWHAPLTAIGHNFGTDYPGFPWLGIICMCVLCVLIGVLLTFITEMSGSIWPAAILHAVNNCGPSILTGYINPDKCGRILGMGNWIGMLISLLITATVIFILFRRKAAERLYTVSEEIHIEYCENV